MTNKGVEKNSSMALDVLMVGAGEYTAGYVPTKDGAASDKPAGVVAITLIDLRRLGLVNRLVLCDRDGTRMPAVRQTLKRKIADVYDGMDVTVDTFPADDVECDDEAYIAAMDSMARGSAVTIFTPDNTHYAIAMAAVRRGLHVLLAKPAVKTLQHHTQLVAEAREHGVIVAVEFHKRFDPIYMDARDRIRHGLGHLSYFSSTMTQPKKQLHTFAGWAGKSSDISYYLNSHHIDFLAWSVAEESAPVSVVAAASRGVARCELAAALAERRQIATATAATASSAAGAAASAGTRGPPESAGASNEGEAATAAADDYLEKVEDTITLMVQWRNGDGSAGTSVHMASWIAPPSDCHTQQHFHFMGHKGEVRVDQAHRGFTTATDANGFATLNPLYMKYTPDSRRRFAGQSGYGYRSIEEFVRAAVAVNKGEMSVDDYGHRGVLAMLNSKACIATTAILEAGRRSLDGGSCPITIGKDSSGFPTLA